MGCFHEISAKKKSENKFPWLSHRSLEITGILSCIFGKNFVKVTVLLNKLLKSWFDEIFFGESKFFIFLHCVMEIYCTFWQKFRESNVFSKQITKELIWRNIFLWHRILHFSTICSDSGDSVLVYFSTLWLGDVFTDFIIWNSAVALVNFTKILQTYHTCALKSTYDSRFFTH